MVMVVKKKAQSALEFLTTYGWAFLVILIMIGALSYFGVLDPSRFLPDKCIFGTGVGACQDYTITTGGNIIFKLINNLGIPVNLQSGTATVTGLTSPCSTPIVMGNVTNSVATNSTGAISPTLGQAGYVPTWNASAILLVNVTGCAPAVGERPDVQVTLTYIPVGSSYTKAVTGDVSVKRVQ